MSLVLGTCIEPRVSEHPQQKTFADLLDTAGLIA